MKTYKTDAWLLRKGEPKQTAVLERGTFTFDEIEPNEVLVEPIFGCWEGNMSHAVTRDPIDICRRRGEEEVVLGNAGVVRVLKPGSAVTTLVEGDFCAIAPIGSTDKYGNMIKAFAYDAPRTIGLLAKQTKVTENQLALLPRDTKYSYEQWAAFSLRYSTAWVNWNLAYGCYRLNISKEENPHPHVWGWGGGVTFAELCLAKQHGCQVAMIASNDDRLATIAAAGITPIDRRKFINLNYDPVRYKTDRKYKREYVKDERVLLNMVKEHTNNEGVAIFIDNIGTPVFHVTQRALSDCGVIATSGWKMGMELTINRATECIQKHIYVHTHGARYSQGVAAVKYAEENGWLPPINGRVYGWDEVQTLSEDYNSGKISSYFPLFKVNDI